LYASDGGRSESALGVSGEMIRGIVNIVLGNFKDFVYTVCKGVSRH